MRQRTDNERPRVFLAAAAAVLLAALVAVPVPLAAAVQQAAPAPAVPETIKVLMPNGSVETMDMDAYLKGVVPAEVSPYWPLDALQAQAVAARCYAATADRHPAEGADVCTTTHCQAWSSSRDPVTDLAVEATHGVVAVYNNSIIEAYYFAHCNGSTRNSEDVWGGALPYCRSVSCPCGNTSYYGHGVGMCQEGACVLAGAGWDYADILEHYYTGAAVTNTPAQQDGGYFAEGTTRDNFVTYLCIANPQATDAEVAVDYYLEGGQTVQVLHQVPAHSRRTFDTADDIGRGKDFSSHIASRSGGPVVVERPMYFNYGGKWTGGHVTIAAASPRAEWYLAEGTTREGFDTYICIENPTDTEARVSLSYFLTGGAGSTDVLHVVGPHSRLTVDPSADIGRGLDFSCRARSVTGTPIVVERPMYFNYGGVWNGGHVAMGAASPMTDWYFAEGTTRSGFATYLCVANPGDTPAELTVSYLLDGANNKEVSYTVPPLSRKTIDAIADVGAGRDFSCRVRSDGGTPVVCERPMYFNYGGSLTGGHDTLGAAWPKNTWRFAEGTTRPDFVTYLCIANLSDKAADVMVTYFKGDGATAEQRTSVPAASRRTFSANDYLGTAPDAAHDVAIEVRSVNNAPLVVERPMYFSYGGVWTGGHDTMGY